jgi:hypothetical protein
MTRSRTAAGVLLLLAATLPARARAQGEDARVLPRGWVEFRGEGIYQQFNSRFGSGGQQALGAPFAAALQPVTERLLAPILPPLQTALTGFFTGTAGQVQNPVTPEAVTAGTIDARLAGDFRRAPFTLSYGLTSRIMVGVTVPFQRNGTAVTSLLLRGGNVGANTNAATNATVLTKISAAYAGLGNEALLPVAGTPAAVELQRRVKALSGGDTLILPTRAVNLADLLKQPTLSGGLTADELDALGVVSAATPFQLGDVELNARIQLANNVRGYPFADSSQRKGFRSTLAVALRLPTASRADTFFLLEMPRVQGHLGVSADLHNDVFLARKFWLTASAGYTQLAAANVVRRPFSAARPFANDTSVPFRTLRRAPGASFRFSFMPRYRLTREFSFAAAYQFEHTGATTYTSADSISDVVLGPLETTQGWTTHSVGVGASYSTIEAFMRGKTPFPLEFNILYRNSVAGSGFAPHAGTIEAGGRILYQLVGRPRPVRPDTATADTARTLPAPQQPPLVTAPGEAPPPGQVRPSAPPPAPPAAPEPAQPQTQQPPPARPTRPAPPPPPPPTSVPPPR